ncbi:NAD(P)/FAD-dependent oxidoreductase [Amycolatopsis sp. TNS106]|uniref:flavin-containing monooxygenase n=1 Tax=Amycolatopsis sp. TNS106 TaxID=2861750 RepID=UPI001C5976F7|nr:NAD(P)/FAD-dependent oxidoreductase [Amycolatopsis sp. TNS106]QXV56960.1 oxidoreductase [Amycolatopsis sp. TNS106]
MAEYDALVIGGGQAGLGIGYRLREAGLDFLIVDAHGRTGDSWRERWDSLELFTPRPFDFLPGMKLPKSAPYYPRKDDIADFLFTYREKFDLPVRHNFSVQKVEQVAEGFLVSGQDDNFTARQVIIAAGAFHTPRIPDCATRLDPGVWQGHSHSYRRPSDVPDGKVLVVGGGNSAAQIADELSATHTVTIASNGPIGFSPRSLFGVSIFWILHLTGMLRSDKDAAISRYVRPYSDTVIGRTLKRKIDRGVVRHIPHSVVDCEVSTVVFADGGRDDFPSVLWSTGYRPSYEWVKVDGALDDAGAPLQDHGVSPVSGLFWIGLPWQGMLNSALVNGVTAESAALAEAILKERT